MARPRVLRSRLLWLLWRGDQNKLVTAVFLPGRLIMTGIRGPIFAVAHGIHAVCVYPESDHFLANSQSPQLAVRAIVLFGPALITVSLYANRSGTIGF